MKLAEITNLRCSEADASTYVLVPDEWDETQFRTAVLLAKNAYIDMMETVPLYARPFDSLPGIKQFREMPPDRTVGDVLREHDEKEKRRKELDDLASKKRRSFGFYLEEQGLKIVQRAEMTFKTDVDWGHRHGQRIRYDGIAYYDWSWEDEDGNERCAKEED